jgi:YVTN family beta-propeller protein
MMIVSFSSRHRALLAACVLFATPACASARPSASAQVPDAPAGAPTVIVANMQDGTATLIDAATHAVRATLQTGTGPHEVAASSDGRWAVVSNYGDRSGPGNSLTVIDLAAATVARTIDLGEYRRPHGAKFLPGDSILVVTSEASQKVVLVEFATGRIAGTVSTSRPASHMLAVSADARVLFTTNVVDGSISRIDLRTRTPGPVMPVAARVEGIAITPDGRQVWVGSNRDSIVVVMDADRGVPIDTLRGFAIPYRLAITADGATALIADPEHGEVRIIDVATRRQRAAVALAGMPEGIATSPDSRMAFVTLNGAGQMAAIDLGTATVAWTAAVGSAPDGIAWARPPR